MTEISPKMKPNEIMTAAKKIAKFYEGHRDERKIKDALAPITFGASHLWARGEKEKTVEEHIKSKGEVKDMALVLIAAIERFNKIRK